MHELDKRILAGRIKDLRAALGETQEQFAGRLNVPTVDVRSYEIAIRRPGYLSTKKLYEAAIEADKVDLADYFRDRMEGLEKWMSDRTNSL